MDGAEDTLRQVAEVLKRIVEDTSVPRNIRGAAKEARKVLLEGEGSTAVRASTAISILDEVSNDPNIPVHARTLIWSCASRLEPASVEK